MGRPKGHDDARFSTCEFFGHIVGVVVVRDGFNTGISGLRLWGRGYGRGFFR